MLSEAPGGQIEKVQVTCFTFWANIYGLSIFCQEFLRKKDINDQNIVFRVLPILSFDTPSILLWYYFSFKQRSPCFLELFKKYLFCQINRCFVTRYLYFMLPIPFIVGMFCNTYFLLSMHGYQPMKPNHFDEFSYRSKQRLDWQRFQASVNI